MATETSRESHLRILRGAGVDPSDVWLSTCEGLSNFVMLVDREYRIAYINRVTDWLTVDSVLGKSAIDFVMPDQKDFFKGKLDEVFQTGNPVAYHIKGFGDQGRPEEYASKVVPIREEGKSEVRLVAVITLDVTAVIRTESHV